MIQEPQRKSALQESSFGQRRDSFWLRIGWYVVMIVLSWVGNVAAIDLYEIQIYSSQTTPVQQLTVELHSNSILRATGHRAKEELRPYEVHETLEATYGLTAHIELGQYLCTAKFANDDYNYAGSRTKLHFGIGNAEGWPVAVGGNIELGYMRRQAEENPLSVEVRPIVEKRFGKLWLVGDFAFEKALNGPGAHDGITFAPSGMISYALLPWLTPALEYYGELGAIRHFSRGPAQQHFLVPTLNVELLPQLELNVGVGIGVTRASNGTFLKSIIGWTF